MAEQPKSGLRTGGSLSAGRSGSGRYKPIPASDIKNLDLSEDGIGPTQVGPIAGDDGGPIVHTEVVRLDRAPSRPAIPHPEERTDPSSGAPTELPTRVVPSDLSEDPHASTHVVPQDITSPGQELDFRAPQKFLHTEVLPRRFRDAGIGAPEPEPTERAARSPSSARRDVIEGLERSLTFWRRAAMGMGGLCLLLAGAMVGQMSLSGSPAPQAPLPSAPVVSPAPAAPEPPRAEVLEQPPIVVPRPLREEEAEEPSTPEEVSRPVARQASRPVQRPAAPPKAPKVSEAQEPASPPAAPAPPKPTKASGLAELEAMLSELKQTPTDVKLFDRLKRKIEERASNLPDAARKRVQSVTTAAELSYDVDQLARALSMLRRSGE